MKKPSLKNKLTADKIEAANRLLVEQTQAEVVKPAENITITPSVSSVSDAEKKPIKQEKPKAVTQPAVKKAAKTTTKTLVAEPVSSKMVRVTIDIPENIHEKLKIKMILSKQTIKQYLLDFIEKDLAKSDFKL